MRQLRHFNCSAIIFGGCSYHEFSALGGERNIQPESWDKCIVADFPEVFESPTSQQDTISTPESRSMSEVSWSTGDVTRGPASQTTRSPSQDSKAEFPGAVARSIAPIVRDNRGRRIDPPVFHNSLVEKVAERKWCNNFHLKSFCKFPNCEFKHGSIDEAQLNALYYVARQAPCRWGSACNDPYCFAGHHCSHQPCLQGKKCKFPISLHYFEVAMGLGSRSRQRYLVS